MTVKDSRTEEERANAADLLKLVMVRKKCFYSSGFTIVSILNASRQNIVNNSCFCHFYEAFSPSL